MQSMRRDYFSKVDIMGKSMKKIIVVTAAAAALAITGCVSSGNASLKGQTHETIGLKEGMTMSEVRSLVGDPFATSFTDGGLTIWNYEFLEGQMTAQSFIPIASMFSSGVKGKKKQLVILFDEQDLVKKFTMSDSDYEQKSGIVRQ